MTTSNLGPPTLQAHHYDFPCAPDQVRHARAFVRQMLPADAAYAPDAALCVSEAFTNAWLHCPRALDKGVRVCVELLSEGLVRVAVTDPGGAPTCPQDVSPGRVDNSRGLGVIESLSASWGWLRHPDESVEVWFTFGP